MQSKRFLDSLRRHCLTFGGLLPQIQKIFPIFFAAAPSHLKPGKAPGTDFICLELLFHAGSGLKFWLCGFLSSCLRQLKIPKIWRRALVVAIPKPSKSVENVQSYRPISLLGVPYKIFERLIYNRVEPIVDPLLPKEQT